MRLDSRIAPGGGRGERWHRSACGLEHLGCACGVAGAAAVHRADAQPRQAARHAVAQQGVLPCSPTHARSHPHPQRGSSRERLATCHSRTWGPGPRAGIHISQPGPLRVGHGGPSEDGSGMRSSRRSASAGEARVSRAVATLAGVAGRSSRPPAGRRFWTGLEAVERGVGPIDFPIEFPMAADPCLWAAGRAIYRYEGYI